MRGLFSGGAKCLLLLAAPIPATAMAQDQPIVPRTLSIPVLINEVPIGSVPGFPQGETLSVNRERLLQTLSRSIAPEALAPLAASEEPFVTIEQLGDLGIDARFDPRSLTLEIKLPAEFSPLTEISLIDQNELDRPANAVQPSEFAGFHQRTRELRGQ